MKRKFAKILGVGLALALVLSFSLVAATPVSAGDIEHTKAVDLYDVTAAGVATWQTPGYVTIQAAIDAAAASSAEDHWRIEVDPDTYPENLTIGSGGGNLADLVLVAVLNDTSTPNPDPSVTIIDGTGENHVIEVQHSSGVTIEGFTLTSSTVNASAIHTITSATNLILKNIVANDFEGTGAGGYGFFLWKLAGTENLIQNCTTKDNEIQGIMIQESPSGAEVVVDSCTVTGNDTSGIYVQNPNHAAVTIKNCDIISNGPTCGGVEVASGADTVTLNYNNIYSNTPAAQNVWIWDTAPESELLDATNNWWGVDTAVGIAALVSGNVDYSPWLLAKVGPPTITDPAIDPDAAARPGDVVTVSATVTDDTGVDTVILSAATEVFDKMTAVGTTFTVALTQVGTTDVYDADLTVLDVSDGSYPLTITATDVASNETTDETLSLTVAHLTVSLYEGWNLISLPLIPDESDITVVISADTLDDVSNVTSVYYFYNDGTDTEWQSYVPGSGGTLTAMEDGKAYFIYMADADTLAITGRAMPEGVVTPPTYNVYEGWNFIGFKSVTDRANESYLNALLTATIPNYSILYGYDNTTGYFRVYPEPDDPMHGTAKLGDMEVGYGYWLYLLTSSGIITP